MIKFCVVCKEKIYRGGIDGKGSRGKGKLHRGERDVTCSPNCSKIYRNVYTYLIAKVRKKYE